MNTAPTFNPIAIEQEIQTRFNPLPGLTPDGLTRQIDEFRAGYLRNMALTMDAMEERDDLLAAVVPKAKSAPTIHGWEINTVDTESEADAKKAAEQKEVLEFFYNNLRATSAIEQDLLGGIELLLEQMMDAKGKRYSCHNLVWKSAGRGRYTVTAHHVPLWFFEAKKGKLRFLKESNMIDGEELQAGAWMISVGRGLMIPCAVAWMFKHLPLRDWLLYCRRHGLPGIEGVTDAAEGTPEYLKLRAAVVAAAGGEFAWIRSQNQAINKIDFGADGDLPYPALVDRMDRAMSAIWRGGDLSTMSKDKQAIGAGGQAGESDIIEARDAKWLTGQLNMRLDRLVLDYVFGEDAPALAYITIKTAKKQDLGMDLKIDEFALKNGHPVSKKQFSERYNRPEPGEGDELLTAPAIEIQTNPQDRVIPAVNESSKFAAAVRTDMVAVAKRVTALLEAEDWTDEPGAFRTQLAELLSNSAVSAADEVEDVLAGAFLAGLLSADEPKVKAMNEKSLLRRFLRIFKKNSLVHAVNAASEQVSRFISSVNESIDGEGEWFRLAPKGEHPNEVGLQVVDEEAARRMVAAFNSVVGKVSTMFRGLPIWVGHPKDPGWRKRNPEIYTKYPHPVGRILELEERDGEVWFKPAFNAAGKELISGPGAAITAHSAEWGMVPLPDRGPNVFRPVLLEGIGLTNFPQISGTKIGLNEEVEHTTNQRKEDTMPDWIMKLLGLKPEATEDEVRTSLQSALNEKQAATTRVTQLESEVGTVKGQLTTAMNEANAANDKRKAERKARAEAVVTSAINEGRIKETDRAVWLGSLEGAADFDAEAAKLGSLQKAVNTQAVNLGERKDEGSLTTVNAINEAVRSYAKDHGLDVSTSTGWDQAYAGAQSKNPALFGKK